VSTWLKIQDFGDVTAGAFGKVGLFALESTYLRREPLH
jgi:hypothetical protein